MRALSSTLARADDSRLRPLASTRWGLLVVALVLALIGVATVHSASQELGPEHLQRQALWVALGLVAMAVAFSVDYQTLATFAIPLYLLGNAALIVVLFAGEVRGGARSWLGLGSITLQPSELAKLTTAVVLARYLSGADRPHLSLRQASVATAIALMPMILVAAEPDLGGAAMFVPMLGGMLLVSGIRARWVAVALVAAVAVAGIGWNLVLLDYQRERVLTFVQPETDPLGAGYQLRQSKIAVGSGELTGKGYGQGTQSQLRFLPARHTDFIFAVLAEEWGFLGVLAVMALYSAYVLNGFRVAQRARDRTGILLVVGLLSTFAFHVLYNTAMVVGLLPITGVPLPFLSYGGSFTLFNFAASGLILGVDFRRHVNR